MGVDISTYRARIGHFQPVNCDQRKPKYKKSRYKITKWNISTFFIFWCLSTSITTPPSPTTHRIPNITPQFRKASLLVPQFHDTQEYLSPGVLRGISGFPGMNSNKVCHMINGNRRSLGYKISSWNCGRGLMSGNNTFSDKLLDIKLFIQNNKPSLFGII